VPLTTVLLAMAAAAAAQEAPPEPVDEPPEFGVESSVVLVDVVVRDRNGRAVRDLGASDFRLFEDGQRQELQSFRVVSGGRPGPDRLLAVEPAPAGEAAAAAVEESTPAVASPPAEEGEEAVPSVIAFVFDRLSPNARNIAHQATQVYLERGHVDGDIVAVFGIDLALHVLQPFTRRLSAIEHGFERALVQANTSFASTRDEWRAAQERAGRNQDLATTLSTGGLAGGAVSEQGALAGSLAVQVAFDQIEARMARSFDALERDQQGFASTNGLKAVVEGLRTVPGRKTVIFFSEGLALPASVLAQFRSVVAMANRAQVSVYSVDAGGLRVQSETAETRDELMTLAMTRARQESSSALGSTSVALTRGLERSEDMLRLNPHAGLGQLAEETGGFLVSDTNDLSQGFGRIQEDMRFHYVLAYTPSDARYDGRFREIAVEVSRPGVRVQSRRGYFAVPPHVVLPARPHEATVVAVLDEAGERRDFPIWASALTFPEPERPGHVAVLVQLSGTEVSWSEPSAEQPDYEADFSILVRFRNLEGEEMDRLSQRYLLSVPARSFDAARQGDVLFFKETDLPPGRYTVEAIAHDSRSDRASVFRGRLEVEAMAERDLRLSSVALVERVEELPVEEQGSGNPFVFGPTMLYPNLGAPFHKSTTPNLGFYFTAYGGGDRASPTQATIELLQLGQTLATLPTPLPEPDDRGRIQYAGALPIEGLPEGDFTLRVSVTDGASIATREAAFSVAR
jgi:VWFA-related protein